MLRKALLVIAAIGMTYGSTALAGYMLYANSEGRSEAGLAALIRFAINPVIAVLIGAFVGLFSKNHPVPVTILGLAPWIVLLLSTPNKPISMSDWVQWLSPILVYLPLAVIAASLISRYRSIVRQANPDSC
jgi:hypothetical protein